MSASLREQVNNAEALVKTKLEELHAKLKDPNLPKDKREKIMATVKQLEDGLQAETCQVRKKCGLQNHKK